MKTIMEPSRELPVIREVDVVVCGGGPSGTAAAIASARNGAKTLLVERYGYIGGMVTGSYITYYMGFGNGKEQIIRGIAQETIDRLREVDGITRDQDESGDCYGDAEIIKCISVMMLEEAGVEILLHSWATAAIVDNGVCKGVFVENKSGRQAILAKIIIDATADADICASAGVETNLDDHDISLSSTLDMIDYDKLKKFQLEHTEKYRRLMDELEALKDKSVLQVKNRSAIDVWDLTHVENESRKELLKKFIFLKRNVPGYKELKIKITAPQLGVRESRKIVGEYTITEDDILADCKFQDTIGRCGAYMKKYENYDKQGLNYDIPYRVLIPKKIDGLLATGRCISATHGAINSLRLVVPCILLGEAAGTAAALASKQNVSPRKVDIKKLQDTLILQGNKLGR